jgi:hypothetical protein
MQHLVLDPLHNAQQLSKKRYVLRPHVGEAEEVAADGAAHEEELGGLHEEKIFEYPSHLHPPRAWRL